ncbi:MULTISPECIES: hypothetical protein [Legionella]|uniref:Uncharacterized protein n=1 Tax=Legionella septentrionalis TaxID=2498109 RepID=A0A433JLN3_9GAMM|nr:MULTISPECIES: hypothetical protein [Legionella]MCP0914085.1 hypothetical protein [Legionella sp. 27cVA30]RUQ90755.1 hypothetical protein EKM59_01420 [Legionella septentrionalis]RUQ99940.1 hypothetical protein ELY11_03585 [Legionella septentrionalis]RUR10216.1 hypothetical protein ELY14_06015 [Legionella septentrionalis]RUR15772.1 hypothetical protein ELY10_04930 [Legionella septentrionalis]
MEIIFQGKFENEEAAESILSVIKLFKDRYRIKQFREIHLTVTLLDEQGDDVELVDSETGEVYRFFEVHRENYELSRRPSLPVLKLVVDNTRGENSGG